MDFENLGKTWEAFAEKDPLWSILAWEGKEDNKWDPEEFFRVGQGEVEHILAQVEKRKHLAQHGAALDFGCGVGRLTLPLHDHFERAHGVDISSEMIRRANTFKEAFDCTNCIFHVNKANDLALFADATFDFVVSLIVLQHMEPTYSKNYLREFVRVLKRGGVLAFQLPDAIEFRADYHEYQEGTEPIMEMYGIRKDEVIELLQSAGGNVLDVARDDACGPELVSYRYFVTK